jgi:hypothetical protein
MQAVYAESDFRKAQIDGFIDGVLTVPEVGREVITPSPVAV